MQTTKRLRVIYVLCAMCYLLTSGCATPQYAIRPTPVPEESAQALEIERTISAVQAKEFITHGASSIGLSEEIARLPVQSIT